MVITKLKHFVYLFTVITKNIQIKVNKLTKLVIFALICVGKLVKSDKQMYIDRKFKLQLEEQHHETSVI